jgi:DNA polymerase III subunit delta'
MESLNNSFLENISVLVNAKKRNRLAHAYLVYSDDSEIRNKFASSLGKAILCNNTTDSEPYCNECSTCKEVDRNVYPDMYIISPVSKSRKIVIGDNEEDADTMRWFQAKFSLSPLNANGRKVGIIYDADRMMVQAQNAFLKTLEEPPKNSYFILVTESPNMLLPTVISRCQTISLLSNRCSYELDLCDGLFELLREIVLCEQKTISKAYEYSEALIELFSDIHKTAESQISLKWGDEYITLDDQTPRLKKILTQKFDAEVSATYIKSKEKFINGIYVWFAELYQMTLGVKHDQLSNSEIIPDGIAQEYGISSESALNYLNKVENFVQIMKWNVREELAIYDLAINLVMK